MGYENQFLKWNGKKDEDNKWREALQTELGRKGSSKLVEKLSPWNGSWIIYGEGHSFNYKHLARASCSRLDTEGRFQGFKVMCRKSLRWKKKEEIFFIEETIGKWKKHTCIIFTILYFIHIFKFLIFSKKIC